jgi:hypothetical protein
LSTFNTLLKNLEIFYLGLYQTYIYSIKRGETMTNSKTGSATSALFAGLAVFIGYSLIRSGASAGNILWYGDGIQKLTFEGVTPVLQIRVRAMNTGNVRYTLHAFAADVEANDTVIGNASFFTSQVIEPRSQVVLLVNIRLMPLSIVNDLITAFQTKNFQFKIEVNGTANVNNLQLPVNLTYNVGF